MGKPHTLRLSLEVRGMVEGIVSVAVLRQNDSQEAGDMLVAAEKEGAGRR